MSDEIEQAPAGDVVIVEATTPPELAQEANRLFPVAPADEGDGSAVDLGIPDAGASLFRDNFTSPHLKADQHV